MIRGLRFACVTLMVFGSALLTYADDHALSEHLAFFDPLVQGEWVGHYSDEETAHFEHVVRWESVHDGHVVRMVKKVDELDFAMETLYYWDPDVTCVSYVTVTNRGQVSTGRAAAEGDTIELLGHDLTPDGQVDYRYTFYVKDDGVLEDRFYRPDGDRWEERHLILYESYGKKESAEPSN